MERWEVTQGWGHDGAEDKWFTMASALDDEWETRVEDEPRLEGIGPAGAATAVDVIGKLDKMPGWGVRVRFEPRNGVLVKTQREERELPPQRVYALEADGSYVLLPPEDRAVPLTQKLVREVGLGNVADQVKTLLADPIVRTQYLGPAWQKPKLRVQHAQQDLHTYAQWANRYWWAMQRDTRSPIRYIIEADGEAGFVRTEKQVRGMVNRARDRNLLTRTESGRAGGHLTDLARRLLIEQGINEGDDHVVTD